ncbi:type II secretion system protein GspH, partial [Mesorhizobium sp. M2D.F.Ca.ET.223.01.1.1]|uniref:prepilin-type N-terminal cleavage/methylation domain-containing protein n=1 Tax=Mesorhizobium sp. M2D.F.Ca.ET.223.01.1.1 TaxID=2563940 RepID=UPI001093238C
MRTFTAAPQRDETTAGFTLIEMMVVLAIIAVVAAIAAPGIVQRYRSDSLETLSNEIISRIRMSRMRAIA